MAYQNLKSNGMPKAEKVDALTLDELNTIKDYLYKTNIRDWAWFVLNLNMGLRASDLFNLKWDDVIYLSNNEYKVYETIKVLEGKTKKPRTLKLNAVCQEVITIYLKYIINSIKAIPSIELSNYMFKSRKGSKGISYKAAHAILNRAAQNVGINRIVTNVGTHSMKKTFGQALYDKGVPVAIIQDIFNHREERVTLRYIGVTKKKIKDAYMNLNIGM